MTRPYGLCLGTMLPLPMLLLLLMLVACGGVQMGAGGEGAGKNGGNGGGGNGGCPVSSGRLKASGVCAAGEDECPFQLTLPAISLQLPRSFRTLEKGQREVQSLKQEVALLKALREEEVANLTQLRQEVQQLRSVRQEGESSSYIRQELPVTTPDVRALKEEVTRIREEVKADLQQLREEVEQLRSVKEEVLQLRRCCESSRDGSQFLNMVEEEQEREDEEVEEEVEEEEEEAQQDQPEDGENTPPGKGETNPTKDPSKTKDPAQTKDPAKTKDPTHTTPDAARKLRELQRQLSGVTRGLRNATAHIVQLEERLSQMQTNANINGTANANASEPCSNYCPAHAPAPLTMVTARDCSDYAVMGRRQDGVYRVTPDPRLGGAVPVWCDMASLGGGWTVIQRRVNGTLSFNRSWADYKKGFGDLGGDLWLGLELVHWLTRGRDMVLRIELQDSRGRQEYAKYEQFYVAGEQLRYKLSVGGYSGTAGDALASGEGGSFRHDQMFFSTADRDNDAYAQGSCAAYYGAGWWFNACMAANLNGRHYRQRYRGVRNGIFWSTWPNATHVVPLTGYRDAFRYVKMMVRPRNYSP